MLWEEGVEKMITPLEIQNKEFRRSIRGYKESEVDEFLDLIIIDYEKLYKENIEFKDKIMMLNEQLSKYRSLEKTLNETLIVAQSAAQEVNANAQKKAELIIQKAEMDAKKIIEDANQQVMQIKQEYENIKKQMYIFKTRFKTLLESQLEAVENIFDEITQDVKIQSEQKNETDETKETNEEE